MEIATPITNWRYSRNTGCSIHGTEQNVGNTHINRLPIKTPISNLFLTGALDLRRRHERRHAFGHHTSQMVLAQMDGTRAVLTNLQIDIQLDGAPQPASSAPMPAPVTQAVTYAESSTAKSAPQATLKAIGSGREITLNAISQPAVLLFHTQDTADDAAKVNAALRAVTAYDTPEKLFIANVVDLHSVPETVSRICRECDEGILTNKPRPPSPLGVDPKNFGPLSRLGLQRHQRFWHG